MRYGDLKKQVAEMVIAKLEPMQKKYEELMSDRAELRRILREGVDRVTPLADATMRLVRQKTGLYSP
jgi:tryptophanyl-tRNA synthetase